MPTALSTSSPSSSSNSNFVALDDLLRKHGRLTLSATLYVSLRVAEQVRSMAASGRHAGSIPASRVRLHGKTSIELAKGRYPSNAPELRAGEAGDVLSDVYELGSLMYRMLTGHRPQGDFEAPSAINPAVDTTLDDLIMSAVAADPGARPYSIDALIKGLQGVFAELDLEPSPSELSPYVDDATVVMAAARPVAKVDLKPVHRSPPPSARRTWADDDDEPEVSVVRQRPDSATSNKVWAVATAVFAMAMLFLVIKV